MANAPEFWEAVDHIRARDDRFANEAYALVMVSLDHTLARLGEVRHVSAAELVTGMCDYARDQFGVLAYTVLERWGIRCAGDVGTIVYQLVGESVLSTQESESQDDFTDVVDLHRTLEEDYFEGTGSREGADG